MPVIWQPIASTDLTTNPATYTLVIIATQDIDVGVIFRFVMWDGLNYPYSLTDPTTQSVFQLTVTEKMTAGTKYYVSMTTLNTKIFGFVNNFEYSNAGAAIPAANFKQFNSLIALAYVPTASGGTGPAGGQPQFAIGFSYHPVLETGCTLTQPTPLSNPSIAATAPNFPDQFSTSLDPIIFNYEIVYPATVPYPSLCSQTYGIKFKEVDTYVPVTGSWLTLRQILAQPNTIIQSAWETINNWVPYSTITPASATLPPDSTPSPAVGPFEFVLEEGQLAVVYFKPAPANYAQNTALPILPLTDYGGPAAIAVVVTAPIATGTTIYATVDGYNASQNGFGPSNPTTSTFVNPNYTFKWVTDNSTVIPAGTVVLFQGIGSNIITVTNAHSSLAVGTVTYNTSPNPPLTFPFPVVSVSFLAEWNISAPQRFITAALSNQYVGDFPDLSPSLTIAPSPFALPSIYGQGQTFNNGGLSGTVQSAMVNSGAFETLDWTADVPTTSLPIFKCMASFSL
jgi:hypothetical protein